MGRTGPEEPQPAGFHPKICKWFTVKKCSFSTYHSTRACAGFQWPICMLLYNHSHDALHQIQFTYCLVCWLVLICSHSESVYPDQVEVSLGSHRCQQDSPAQHLCLCLKLAIMIPKCFHNFRQFCYESWWGCVGKDPDAQGSGSAKRDLLGAGRNQSQYQASGRNTAVRGKAEPNSWEHEQGSKPGNPIHIKHTKKNKN